MWRPGAFLLGVALAAVPGVSALATDGPDLVPASLSGPTAIDAGVAAVVTWDVSNDGGTDATGTWTDLLVISDDTVFGNPGDQSLGSKSHTGPLAAGSAYSVSLGVTIPNVAAGQYYLILRTDVSRTVAETSETNNDVVHGPFTIRTPDLVPTAVAHEFVAVEGTPTTVTWTVENQGTGEARAPWTDFLVLSRDLTIGGIGDVVLAVKQHATPLAAGAANTDSVTLLVPGNVLPGPYFVILHTDIGGAVIEEQEANDLASTLPLVWISVPP